MAFKKKSSSSAMKYLNFGLSFGLTMAITVYLLAQGGKWLDNRLDTSPIFMSLGIILAIATVFKRLFTDIKTLDKDLSEFYKNEKEE